MDGICNTNVSENEKPVHTTCPFTRSIINIHPYKTHTPEPPADSVAWDRVFFKLPSSAYYPQPKLRTPLCQTFPTALSLYLSSVTRHQRQKRRSSVPSNFIFHGQLTQNLHQRNYVLETFSSTPHALFPRSSAAAFFGKWIVRQNASLDTKLLLQALPFFHLLLVSDFGIIYNHLHSTFFARKVSLKLLGAFASLLLARLALLFHLRNGIA